LTSLTEHPGRGMEGVSGEDSYRLGHPEWAIGRKDTAVTRASVVLARNGTPIARFSFEDELRPSAADAIHMLRACGLSIEILSGDGRENVQPIADALGISFRAQVDPAGKIAHIEQLQARGHKVLMVGDGINDAPALAAAHVSIAPGSAADIGRAAADFVFLRDSLLAVPHALAIARSADRLVRQNLWIAALYNAVAVPLAILGLVTPLIAAVAMSLSSLTVVANSLRLRATAVQRREPVRASDPAVGQPVLEGAPNG
jgi:Cu2+-exporting ATPase